MWKITKIEKSYVEEEKIIWVSCPNGHEAEISGNWFKVHWSVHRILKCYGCEERTTEELLRNLSFIVDSLGQEV